jgi:hypothetical protein
MVRETGTATEPSFPWNAAVPRVEERKRERMRNEISLLMLANGIIGEFSLSAKSEASTINSRATSLD